MSHTAMNINNDRDWREVLSNQILAFGPISDSIESSQTDSRSIILMARRRFEMFDCLVPWLVKDIPPCAKTMISGALDTRCDLHHPGTVDELRQCMIILTSMAPCDLFEDMISAIGRLSPHWHIIAHENKLVIRLLNEYDCRKPGTAGRHYADHYLNRYLKPVSDYVSYRDVLWRSLIAIMD